MIVRSISTQVLDIPFHDGGKGVGITPTTWNRLEIMLVRVEDDEGNVGWGEGFGYFVVDATRAVVERLISPSLVGERIDDIPAWNRRMQLKLHLFGRYGITLFALSAVDMALWDLAAKRAGLPLYRLLAGSSPSTPPLAAGAAARSVPYYASLVRYADVPLAVAVAERAASEGYTSIKLHELDLPEIRACREALGADVSLSVDVNCVWENAHAEHMTHELAALGIRWLEEPIFPPEDMAALARLRGRLPIAAGENWCTSGQFAAALSAGAVDLAQPSVTKVGGVSEFLAVAELCAAAQVPLMPHTPYFGPGFFASLQLAAAIPSVVELEYLYVDAEAFPAPLPAWEAGRSLRPSERPGIGFEPDPAMLKRYRRG
jgi:L-alanine-DL-glutamate epimerase-like enolase superfamily enzyme